EPRMTSGWAWMEAGAPSAITRPWFITITVSEMDMTIRMSCSTRSTVVDWSRIRRIRLLTAAFSAVVMPAPGSSSSSRRGRAASATARRDGRGPEPHQRDDDVLDPAAGGAQVARDRVEGRRLAGAVRPDDARDRAGVDVEGHAGERRDAAEADGEVADREGQGAF